jgi:hypothetical protein
MVPDPNGFFRITIDHNLNKIILYHHSPEGELIGEFSGDTPQEVGWQLTKSKAVSDIYHSLYLGGQLERAYHCLRKGLEYSQDKALLD